MKRVKVDIHAPSSAEDKARLAELLEARQPPGTRYTERAFLQGRENGKQFQNNPGLGNFYRSKAKAAGVSTVGRVYEPGIARYAGDPQAWIEGTGDLLRVARERNLTVSGCVEHKGTPMPPPVSKPIADDIVERFVNKQIAQDPGLAQRKSRRELREAAIDKHAMKRSTTKE